MLKYVPILALALAAGPALAQSTQSPPAPNSGQAMPQSPNSMPPGAANMSPAQSPNQAGSAIGGTSTATVSPGAPGSVVTPGSAQTTTVPTTQSR